jgi:hypothetical protein
MVLKNGQIKCDECGEFISYENCKVFYQPDTQCDVERIEHYHKKECNKNLIKSVKEV